MSLNSFAPYILVENPFKPLDEMEKRETRDGGKQNLDRLDEKYFCAVVKYA